MSGTWTEFAGDIARTLGSPGRLKVEPARAQQLRNARPVGATVGVVLDAAGASGAGAWPTNWSLTADDGTAIGATGLAWEVTATTGVGGGNGVQIRVSGTPSATATATLNFESRTHVVGAGQLIWSAGVEAALVAGSTAGFSSLGVSVFRMTAGGALAGGDRGITQLEPTVTNTRKTVTRTFGTGPARAGAGLYLAWTSGTPVDVTLSLRWVQMEDRAPTTPILPPVGSPSVGTVGGDRPAVPFSVLGLPASGAGTYLWGGVIDAAAAATDQVLFQIDDGTNDNSVRVRNIASGSTLDVTRVAAASAASSTSLGSMTAGAPFACGMTMNGSGRAYAIIAGGTGQEVTGAVTTGLTTLRPGVRADGTAQLGGGIRLLRVTTTVMSDAELAAAVNGLVP